MRLPALLFPGLFGGKLICEIFLPHLKGKLPLEGK